MGLAEEIQQKEFKSERQKALVNMIYTHNYVINEMNSFYKEIGITRQQYNVLRILRGQHPEAATVNLIKERMLDKMSDASRIVQRLLKRGLVAKSTASHDKRVVEVTISSQGLELLKNSDAQIRGFEHLFDNLTDQETIALNKILDKIRN